MAKGFVFMDTPGYDPVSAPGRWRGKPSLLHYRALRYVRLQAVAIKQNRFRFADVSAASRRHGCRLRDIIDGEESVEQAEQRIFDLILSVASGERTKSEHSGAAEFAPWQIGATV